MRLAKFERWNRLHPLDNNKTSHVETLLEGDTPVIAVSDYVRAVPQLISTYITAPMTVLGTDGFGRSDTRVALRSFFEVDRYHIVVAALVALQQKGLVSRQTCAAALKKYAIETDCPVPWRADYCNIAAQ